MKTTPFTPYHIRNGARMAGFAGYDMPIEFTGINDEHTAVRARAGVFDVSHMGEIWVKGPRALDLLRYVGSNDAASLYDGKIQYSCLPNGRGGIVDDILVYRIDAETYLLVVNAANVEKDWNHLVAAGERFGLRPGRELYNASDEIAQLAQEFNSLTDRLQTTENARRRFVSDASHELKTPLAAIRLLTDSILQTENIDRETAREFVTDIGQEAERLSRITEDLLRLTRLDSNVLERPVVVDALPVLEQVMRMMSLVAQEKGTELTYRAEGTCTMLATRDEIHQIIYNLTDNAVKYTPPGSTVQVSLFREGDQVVLTVEDNGAGIPEEDLPRIFERFYRVDKARSRAAGGTGLGLAIVRDTVEKRGGTVEAANRPGGGAVFTVRWPWREGGGQT